MKLNLNNYRSTLKVLMLPEFWEGQLTSGARRSQGEALRNLEYMSDDALSSTISKQATAGRKNIRKHAKSIFIRFDSYDAFKFLEDDFDRDFNALDEVRLHNSLKEKAKTRELPNLIRWVVNAKNNEYKAFLIKEIGYFNQKDNAPQLLEIFRETDSYIVKSEIIRTLGLLDYKPAIPHFIREYDYSHQKVQDEIIEAMGLMGGTEALEFLEKIYYQTHNKETLIHIIRNIYILEQELGHPTFNKLKDRSESDFEKSVFAFVQQEGFAK